MSSQVIIIIGLPGSGKSTWIQNNIDESYIVYDDCLNESYFEKIFKKIKQGQKVIFADPRFCFYKNFDFFYCYLTKYLDKANVQIICFDGADRDNICFQNIMNRETNPDKIRRLEHDIRVGFSPAYHTSNYPNPLIIPVYQSQ